MNTDDYLSDDELLKWVRDKMVAVHSGGYNMRALKSIEKILLHNKEMAAYHG